MVAERNLAAAAKKRKKPEPEPEPEEAVYTDQEDEWNDVAPKMVPFAGEQSEARGIMRDLHGSKKGDRGTLASRTDLSSADQAAAMMELRIMHKHYPDFGIDEAPEWLESYRVSINRGGRREDVEVLRGNVPLNSANQENQRPRTW
jgi:hypothetical protein